MGVSKKSINRGIMRIGIICSIPSAFIGLFLTFVTLDNHNLQLLWSLIVGLVTAFVVLLLFKSLSWIIAGFFD
tara:strand:- start:321 stop:539 length:219 start_codon:yes stop_codon:yes gene_type:complete